MKKIADVPIFMLTVLLPLSILFHMETIELLQYPWFPNQRYWIDLFLYGKSILLQITAVIMLFMMLKRKIKTRSFRMGRGKRVLIVLSGLFILSAIFSKYPRESFMGSIEQYESIGVLLSYLIVIVYCCNYATDETHSRNLCKFLFLGLGISCVIGLFQFFQLDIWNLELGKKILIPESFASLRENLRFSQDERGFGRVYMVLYNPTYAGIYLVMMLPFLLLIKNKITNLLLIPAMVCLIGTMSKTAWIAAVFILIFGYFILSRNGNVKKNQKCWIVLGSIAMIVLGLVFYAFASEDGVLKSDKKLQQVVGEEDYIRIVYQGNTLYFSEFPKDDGVTYKIVDEEGKEPDLIWSSERGEIDSLDPRFKDLHFKVYQKDGIGYAMFRYEDIVFRFTDQLGTGKYEYVSINGKPDELVTADVFCSKGDFLLNGRGYIWNRIIPLIADNLLLGTGPDTFIQVFPHDDYVARANLGHGFFTEILTNAHSLYFQIALQNGVLALIVIGILLGVYLKNGWKSYSQKESYSEQERIGLACFLGSVGYLICGFTFASSVCTTPIFVVLVGTGWGIQRQRTSNH